MKVFAKRSGIEHKAARQGIAITGRHFLQVSEPIKATGLLSDSASIALKPVAANNITYVFSLKLEQPFKILILSSLSIASLCLNTVFGNLTFNLNFFGLNSISLYSRKVLTVIILSLIVTLEKL